VGEQINWEMKLCYSHCLRIFREKFKINNGIMRFRKYSSITLGTSAKCVAITLYNCNVYSTDWKRIRFFSWVVFKLYLYLLINATLLNDHRSEVTDFAGSFYYQSSLS